MKSTFTLAVFISFILGSIIAIVFQFFILDSLFGYLKDNSYLILVLASYFSIPLIGFIFYKLLFKHVVSNRASYFERIVKVTILIFTTISLFLIIALLAIFAFNKWFDPEGWGSGLYILPFLFISLVISIVTVYFIHSRLNPPTKK